MSDSIPVLIEHRIVAFALGHPGTGPAAIDAASCVATSWGQDRSVALVVAVGVPVSQTLATCYAECLQRGLTAIREGCSSTYGT